MKTVSIMMALLATTLVTLSTAVAGPRGPWHEGPRRGGGGFHGGPGLVRMLDRLDLSAEQKREIAPILAKHRDEIGRTLSGMTEARKALREAVTADEYSEASIRGAVQKLSEQEERAAVLGARILSEVRPILTAEQKDRLKTFASRHGGGKEGFADGRMKALDDWIAKQTR